MLKNSIIFLRYPTLVFKPFITQLLKKQQHPNLYSIFHKTSKWVSSMMHWFYGRWKETAQDSRKCKSQWHCPTATAQWTRCQGKHWAAYPPARARRLSFQTPETTPPFTRLEDFPSASVPQLCRLHYRVQSHLLCPTESASASSMPLPLLRVTTVHLSPLTSLELLEARTVSHLPPRPWQVIHFMTNSRHSECCLEFQSKLKNKTKHTHKHNF